MPRWKAQPHTLAKIAILRGYLNAWFPILGSSMPHHPIFYIDGFAGPGRYVEGQPGSPLVALNCAGGALDARLQLKRWRAAHVTCLFVETDVDNLASLEAELSQRPDHPWIHHKTFLGDFDTVLETLRREYPAAFAEAPLFVLLDPFGPTGLSLHTVESILESPRSEVLLHFDADGATRMIQALEHGYNKSSSIQLTRIFGGDDWRGAINRGHKGGVDFDRTTRDLVSIYLTNIRKLADYAYPFQMITPMKTEHSQVGYYLIFASKHPLGLTKMKEAMRQVGDDSEYRFSNFRTQRPLLFSKSKDPSVDALVLHEHFLGKVKVSWRDVQRWVLNETVEVSSKPLLKYLESNDLLKVHSPEPRKRKLTYPKHIEERLHFDFVEGAQDG
jgi:three-Cys-motif partner protein